MQGKIKKQKKRKNLAEATGKGIAGEAGHWSCSRSS